MSFDPMRCPRADVEFRISELIDWVCNFIRRGDEENARTWACQLARCGRALLRDDGLL